MNINHIAEIGIRLGILCFGLITACVPSVQAVDLLQSDQDALVLIDQELDQDNHLNWYDRSTNTNPGNVDGWDGVTWSNTGTNDRVIQIYAPDKGLTNVGPWTGLHGLTGLKDLFLRNNNLSSLDVSANTALTCLYVNQNSLSSLDVSANTALTELDVSNNNLNSLDVSANTALTWLYVNQNSLSSLDVSANTALAGLDVSNNTLNSLDVSANSALEGLNVNNNKLPLSQLYSYMYIPNLYLGKQKDVPFASFGSALATGASYDDLAPESILGGVETRFTVLRSDDSVAVEGVDYTMSGGTLIFLVPGEYVVSMQNDTVYSKGQMIIEENGSLESFNFETTNNPDGVIHPLATVYTGKLKVLSDDNRVLVLVNEAGASINASRLAAGLDKAFLGDKIVLDGELGQLYSAALESTDDAGKALSIINQLHGETLAGGMDAVLRSAAIPFMSRLHGRAGVRPVFDSRNLTAANSWSAYAQLTGSSSGRTGGIDASAAGVGQFASMSSHDGFMGYDLKDYGAFVSLDRVIGCGDGRVGVALGYSHTKVDWDDFGNKSSSDNFTAGLYGAWFRDAFALTAQANFGYADAGNTRYVPAANTSAKADYDMYWLGAGVEASHAFDLGNCFLLTPSLGVDYLYSHTGSFKEKSTANIALRADSHHSSSFDTRAGVELAKSFFHGNSRITPSLNLGLGYTLGDRKTTVNYRFASIPNLPSFRAESATLDRLRFTVGANLDIALNDRVTLEATYQGDFQKHYNAHAFRLGVGVSF